MSEQTYTTEQAAVALDIPAKLIAQWKHRQRITPAGYARGRGHDAPLYRLSELEPLVQEYRDRQRDTATRRARLRRLASGAE